ncbi:MAG: hypothetical protein KAX65_00145 [Caldilineaceae bacterium]|nr:hypothetical protein [Caldilineaceae bacterium]
MARYVAGSGMVTGAWNQNPSAPPSYPTTTTPTTPTPNPWTPTTTPTTQTAAPSTSSAPPAFDWRQGAWQVANRWAPGWAMNNPYTNITDVNQVTQALANYIPAQRTPAYAQYNNDLTYLKAGAANTAMPSWYGIQQPWGQVSSPNTNVPGVGYTPQYAPTFDWSAWGGQTAVNPVQQYSGTPAWMNNPSWITDPALTQQAEKWAAVMVPWAQTQQNAYQYANDANEAQRRYNLDMAWRQAQDQFTMDQAQRTADYQKVRDAQEFELGRQQIYGRNQTPNVRWQRNWG